MYSKGYLVPYFKRSEGAMVEADIIDKSKTISYWNLFVAVMEKDGHVRLHLDVKKINQIIIPGRDSSELTDEVLQWFSNSKILNVITPKSSILVSTFRRE